ncbi:MAG: glycosyltransferase family 4 protein [Thiotrichales bacterium]
MRQVCERIHRVSGASCAQNSVAFTPIDLAAHQLNDPYLVIVSCPFYDRGDGRLYVSDDWRNDLELHFGYIRHLILAAPVHSAPEGMLLHAFEDIVPHGVTAEAVPLPGDLTRLQALLNLPRVVWRLRSAIARSALVHSDVIDGGHWYPYGLVASPLARLYRRFIIHFVENVSLQLGEAPSWKARLRSRFIERLAHRFLLHANAVFVSYRESAERLIGAGHSNVCVLPYVYIHGRDMITETEFNEVWREKLEPGVPLRAAVFSRLTDSKGIDVLLNALRNLADQGVPLELDVYGKGELEAEVCALAANVAGPMRVRYRGVLPYDRAFLENLRRYHVVVIPSLSHEQPRILFDSLSQGTPVVASNTLGIKDYVAEGGGVLVEAGEPRALAAALAGLVADRGQLRARAIAAVNVAQRYSIESNHAERARFIGTAYAQFKSSLRLRTARVHRARNA